MQPPDRLLCSVGCVNKESCDYVAMELDVGNGNKLYLLVDSGADISLLKSRNLLGSAEFEPKEKVRVKSVDGSVIETHGSIETKIRECDIEIPFCFQLVGKQIDLKGDGILGRDFLKKMQAQICYGSRTLTFKYAGTVVQKRMGHNQTERNVEIPNIMTSTIRLTPRSETVVRLPAAAGSVAIIARGVHGRVLSQSY